MRIGIFTDVYEPYISGVVTSIKNLKAGLEEKEHIVYIVTINTINMKNEYDEFEKILRVPGVPTGLYENIRLSSIYPIKALKIIRKWKLDIIHMQTELGIGTFARILAKHHNIPLVYTYHTQYDEHLIYLTKGIWDETGRKILKVITKIFCDNIISQIITPTKKIQEILENKYKVIKPITVIPSGLEIEKFYKENFSKNVIDAYKKDLGIKKDDFIIISLGRIGKEKNIKQTIDGMKGLVKKSKKYKLLIVGDGPEKKELEKQAKKLKIEENIIFVGSVNWNQTPIYYNLGDIFITTSRSETQGLTVIEALAASVPVFCINDDAFKQIVIDKTNGRIFKNTKELITMIEEIRKNKKTLKKMSIEARLSIAKYSKQHFASNVLRVYRKATGQDSEKRLGWVSKFKKKGD